MGYLGSKGGSGVFQTIVAAMPPHDTYIETHLGGGAVMLAKPPSLRSIGIDLDPVPLGVFSPPYPVELINADCVAYLEAFDFAQAGRVLVYADPPYLETTRTSHHRYTCEYTIDDHIRLILALRALPDNVAVILSGYPSGLYDEMLPDWRTLEFQAMTRGGPRTEKLWMNFEANAAFWSTYAGQDRTDRQRIKRKAARWVRMFYECSPGEQVAILAAILAGAPPRA